MRGEIHFFHFRFSCLTVDTWAKHTANKFAILTMLHLSPELKLFIWMIPVIPENVPSDSHASYISGIGTMSALHGAGMPGAGTKPIALQLQ